ncbi:MAG: hypothetical protein JRN15_10290, partial [Nitrososphaerota archaeon]|nr:hypothetical protein [Nitrososphaerota archaeon]
LRGGFGIFYERLAGNDIYDNGYNPPSTICSHATPGQSADTSAHYPRLRFSKIKHDLHAAGNGNQIPKCFTTCPLHLHDAMHSNDSSAGVA